MPVRRLLLTPWAEGASPKAWKFFQSKLLKSSRHGKIWRCVFDGMGHLARLSYVNRF